MSSVCVDAAQARPRSIGCGRPMRRCFSAPERFASDSIGRGAKRRRPTRRQGNRLHPCRLTTADHGHSSCGGWRGSMSEAAAAPTAEDSPLAIICGGGSLPFAVADAVRKRGRRVVLFAIRGWADPQRVATYPHHWAAVGQFGWFCRLARQEGCRDVVFIGSMVRPAIWHIRPDFKTLRLLPRIYGIFRGGDDHLL